MPETPEGAQTPDSQTPDSATPTNVNSESSAEPTAATPKPRTPRARTPKAETPSTPAPEAAPTAIPLPAGPSAPAAVEAPVAAPPAPPAPPTSTPVAAAAPIDPAAHPAIARKRTGATVGVVAAIAAAALVGGVSGAGVALWATTLNADTTVPAAGPATITVNDADDANLITAVAASASPSVVTISVTSDSAGGTGSGVVIDEAGYIITNAHVVTLDGAAANPSVEVQTNDGRLLDATIVGVDPIYDLAVVKVEDADLPAITFGDSTDLNVGDTTIAIGAPLGLAGTVTNGIVSALNRSITVASSAVPEEATPDQAPDEQSPEQGPFDFWNFDLGPDQQAPQQQTQASSSISLSVIQTDAAINPGNSGGALLNSDGELIGINVAIATAGSGSSGQAGSIGVGFSIPSSVAQRVASELIENGTATHGLLGASVADVSEDEAQVDATVAGASIVELVPGGAAEAAGLKVGDIVTGIDGLPVTNRTDLTAQVRALPAGAETTITYVRGDRTATVDVTLGALE